MSSFFVISTCAGAYGMVISAKDGKTGSKVAVKKVTPLTNQTFCQRTLREIILLSRIKHDNIVILQNVIAGDEDPLAEVYLVLNLMETDLHKLLDNPAVDMCHVVFWHVLCHAIGISCAIADSHARTA